MSGELRSFQRLASNFVASIQRPNDADVFSYLHVAKADEATVEWMRAQPWSKALVAIPFTRQIRDFLISEFPEYSRMQAHDIYERAVIHKSSVNRIAMWRGIYISNRMRSEYEYTHNVRYTHVVRMRPDTAFGVPFVDLRTIDLNKTFYFESDGFAVGEPRQYDIFADVYPHFARLFRERPSRLGGNYVSESLAYEHFRQFDGGRIYARHMFCVSIARDGMRATRDLVMSRGAGSWRQ